MSVDVTKITSLMRVVNILWSSPIQIGLSIYFIYHELGWPIFVGFCLMLLSIPLFIFGYIYLTKYQKEQLKYKDKRVKMIGEIIGGIKVLKLFGWEPSFIEKVLYIVV